MGIEHVILPEKGISFAELGQQTASGMAFIGVAHMPPWPVDNFTPVKNIPTTTLSKVIELISILFSNSSFVSNKILISNLLFFLV